MVKSQPTTRSDDTIRIGLRISPGNFLFCLLCGLAVLVVGLVVREIALRVTAESVSLKTLNDVRADITYQQGRLGKQLRSVDAVRQNDVNRLWRAVEAMQAVAEREPDPDAKWYVRIWHDYEDDARSFRCQDYKELSSGDGFAVLELNFGDDAKMRIRCKWYETMTPCPIHQCEPGVDE